jgi:hypothetical protein
MREIINKLSIEILPTEGRLAKNVDAVTLYFSAEVDNISTNVFKSNNPNIKMLNDSEASTFLRRLYTKDLPENAEEYKKTTNILKAFDRAFGSNPLDNGTTANFYMNNTVTGEGVWDSVSRRFAQTVTGEVVSFVGEHGQIGRILYQTEFPTLKEYRIRNGISHYNGEDFSTYLQKLNGMDDTEIINQMKVDTKVRQLVVGGEDVGCFATVSLSEIKSRI